jgi:hypothetical protein
MPTRTPSPISLGRYQDFKGKVLKAIEAVTPADPVVLCVPACITTSCPEAIIDSWPEPADMVIANSAPVRSSVIRIECTTKLELAERQNNTIKIEAFPSVVSN